MKILSLENMDKNMEPGAHPFFSIVLTTYNRASLLKRALDSLFSQTEQDWEAIIVDDESTDNTYSEIRPYLELNHAIRYIRKAHSGEAMSKNTGINATNGKFISFLDSDDEYDPVHLESRKKILLDKPSIRLLYGGAHILGNQFVPDRFDLNKQINLNECVIGGTFFIEKNTLRQLNGFSNIILGTDADLFERALKAGIPMMETKLTTYIYHHENEDSITNMLINNKSKLEIQYDNIRPK